MKIYLVRHTTPAVERGVCYGHSDVPLAESFEDEFEALRKHLPANPGRVISSPLNRCRRLAEKLVGDDYEVDPRLIELNFGQWEMRNWREISQEKDFRWAKEFVDTPPPNGESYRALAKRVGPLLEQFSAGRGRVILVSHGGVIRAMLAAVLGLALENSFTLEVEWGSVSLLEFNGELKRIKYINRGPGKGI